MLWCVGMLDEREKVVHLIHHPLDFAKSKEFQKRILLAVSFSGPFFRYGKAGFYGPTNTNVQRFLDSPLFRFLRWVYPFLQPMTEQYFLNGTGAALYFFEFQKKIITSAQNIIEIDCHMQHNILVNIKFFKPYHEPSC